MAEPAPVPTPGPWNQVRSTKVTVNALEFNIVTKTESSHVPPSCPCHEEKNGGEILDVIRQAAAIIMQKLEEIRAAQRGGINE